MWKTDVGTKTYKSEGGLVNQREGQIITEYLAAFGGKQYSTGLNCETTHTNPDILTEKSLTPWTRAN